MATSCLLPQDGNVLPIVDGQNPPKKNRRPVIDKNSAHPTTVTKWNPACPQTFNVTVIDPDNDTIRSEWFVDPNEHFTTLLNGSPPVAGVQKIATSGGVEIDSPNGLGTNGTGLGGPYPNGLFHILVVWVSDGEFVSAGQAPPLDDGGINPNGSGIEVKPHLTFFLPDGGGCFADGGPCVDPSGTDSFTWVVTQTTDCPKP